MATQYTTILKLALPAQGELSGTWGDVVNNNITAMVEEAVAGRKVINTWTANSHTLTSADGTTSESRAAILTLTDTGTALSGAGTVVCPAASKIYIVENGTAQVITVKTASGTGIAVPVGKNMVVFCDGTNVEEGISNIASLSIGGDGATVTGIKDEDDMSSNSATKLATQQSIKAYVDSQVTAQDLDVTDGSATISIDLDSESLGILGGTGIGSTASGNNVTVAIDATVATLTGSQTLTNKTLTSPDINAPDIDGGAIDDAVIGGATPAAGSFTTIAASGNVDFNADVDVDGTLETDALTINGVASVPFEAADHSKLDGIEANADVTDTANVTSAGALMDSEVTNLAQVKAFDSSDYATAAQGTTADAALPRTGGAMTGAITTNSTFDGRDVSADGTKLDGIEANADVTDATNVTAAGALMDSELTNITAVKALNQGVATTDSPTFAGITTSGTTNTANLTVSGTQGSDGQVLTSTGSGVQWEDAAGGGVTGITSNTGSSGIITISSSNKVGIGQFVGDADAHLEVYYQGSSASNSTFMVRNFTTTAFLVAGDSKVGVKRSSPSSVYYDFDVNGNVRIDDTLSVGNIRIGNNNTESSNAQGTDGQVLTSTGSGIAWEDPSAPSTPGINNVRLGTNAGANFNNFAERNVAIGVEAAQDFITDGQTQADDNVAVGYRAMGDGRSPLYNVAVGSYAAESLRYTTATRGVVIGYKAMQASLNMSESILIGSEAGKSVTGATHSVIIGDSALYNTTTSVSELCAVGADSMYNYSGTIAYTAAFGYRAGYNVTNGFANTILGNESGGNLTTGDYNTVIGWRSKTGTGDRQKAIVLGANVIASGDETFTFGYDANDSAIANGGTTITAPSDERYKEDITDSTAGLSFIKDLRPVTFRWKKEKDIPTTQNAYVENSETRVMNDRTNHGFIAQEVKAAIDAHSEIKDGFDMWSEDETDGRQRIGPSALIPILVKAIQELEARVSELEGS